MRPDFAAFHAVSGTPSTFPKFRLSTIVEKVFYEDFVCGKKKFCPNLKKLNKQQRAQLRLQQHRQYDSSTDDELPSGAGSVATSTSNAEDCTCPRTLKTQIIERDARIAELEVTVSELTADLHHLRNTHELLCSEHQTLLGHKGDLSLVNSSLNSLKRKAQTTFTEELAKKQKQIKRLETARDTEQDATELAISSLKADLVKKSHHRNRLERELSLAKTHMHSRDLRIISLETALRDKHSSYSVRKLP
ncbi:hypothetical protein B0H17DRAFT_1140834 [Mycena rosella]|uniref:Uncharacterized protein n=1 Tax=Mycena rosella TaxID=1033263 RepID=A0AAD7G703_MYCRO|nr:hypothetical protein B0H17DRAFT_1140834 [Mycena rosella]